MMKRLDSLLLDVPETIGPVFAVDREPLPPMQVEPEPAPVPEPVPTCNVCGKIFKAQGERMEHQYKCRTAADAKLERRWAGAANAEFGF